MGDNPLVTADDKAVWDVLDRILEVLNEHIIP